MAELEPKEAHCPPVGLQVINDGAKGHIAGPPRLGDSMTTLALEVENFSCRRLLLDKGHEIRLIESGEYLTSA